MIEKPNISDEKIIISLKENYSIHVNKIEFLPIGNDASSFAYYVERKDGISSFLKVKREISNLAGLFVPQFLKNYGIEQVIAPLSTKTGNLHAEMDEFSIILYPFVLGQEAMSVGMTDFQWAEFGSVLKRIHTSNPTEKVLQFVQRESFIPKWGGVARALHEQVTIRNYDEPYQKQLALFWREKAEEIQALVERTEMIGQRLQETDLEFFLCHADIHTANILLTPEQDMFIVDWDDTLFAPKERDLMFVLDENTIHTREQQMFFEGYGNVEIDKLTLAYYRYEWCVQEIGDFGERVFLTEDSGENTKKDSVEGFMRLFSQGDVVEAAFNTPVEI